MNALIAVLASIGAVTIGCALLVAAVTVYDLAQAKSTSRRQAAWDTHVDEALRASETPVHDQLVAEMARDIEAEWAALNQGAGQ